MAPKSGVIAILFKDGEKAMLISFLSEIKYFLFQSSKQTIPYWCALFYEKHKPILSV